ncbi:hypothetical protein QG37_02192 [Candidozyma auris]|nr:hypothetical protein QG37_02192 [[Candida] auris]
MDYSTLVESSSETRTSAELGWTSAIANWDVWWGNFSFKDKRRKVANNKLPSIIKPYEVSPNNCGSLRITSDYYVVVQSVEQFVRSLYDGRQSPAHNKDLAVRRHDEAASTHEGRNLKSDPQCQSTSST